MPHCLSIKYNCKNCKRIKKYEIRRMKPKINEGQWSTVLRERASVCRVQISMTNIFNKAFLQTVRLCWVVLYTSVTFHSVSCLPWDASLYFYPFIGREFFTWPENSYFSRTAALTNDWQKSTHQVNTKCSFPVSLVHNAGVVDKNIQWTIFFDSWSERRWRKMVSLNLNEKNQGWSNSERIIIYVIINNKIIFFLVTLLLLFSVRLVGWY